MSNLGQFYGVGFPINSTLNQPYNSKVQSPGSDGTQWIGNNACSAFAWDSSYSYLPESLTSIHSIFLGPEADGSWFPYTTYPSIAYNPGGNVFVTGWYTGNTLSSSGGIGYRSTNAGTSWTRFSFPNPDREYRILQYCGNKFVGVANSSLTNGIITSTDGVTWTSITVGGSTTIAQPQDVASNGSTYYVAHEANGTGYYYSTDSGATWTSAAAPYAFKNLSCIGQGTIVWCPSASLFLATTTNSSVYMTSPTGATWTANTTSINFARNSMRADQGGQQKFAASASIIVCMGYGGNYTTSTDGVTWTAPALLTPTNPVTNILVHQFYYDGTRFCARVQQRMWYSTDGSTWTEGKKIGGFTLIIPQSNGVLFGFQFLSASVVTQCLRVENPTKTTPATIIPSVLGVTVFTNQTYYRIR